MMRTSSSVASRPRYSTPRTRCSCGGGLDLRVYGDTNSVHVYRDVSWHNPSSGNPRNAIDVDLMPSAPSADTVSRSRRSPYARYSDAVGFVVRSARLTPSENASPLVICTTRTDACAAAARAINPPAPKVPSSGCGEMTSKRVLAVRLSSNFGRDPTPLGYTRGVKEWGG